MRVALITGASKGIGAAVATRLDSNWHVILVARSSGELEEVAKRCKAKTTVVLLDVCDRRASTVLREVVASAGGVLHLVVIGAGVSEPHTLLDNASEDAWRKIIDVNFTSLVTNTQALAPYLARPGGVLILMGSILAFDMQFPGLAVYAGTKAAVRSFAIALFSELQHEGVKVSCVEPGLVNTDMGVKAMRAFGEEFSLSPIEMASVEEIARAIMFCYHQPSGTSVMELVVDNQAQPSADLRRFLKGSTREKMDKVFVAPGKIPVCFISGASSGVGRACALAFSGRGFAVVICGRNLERLRQVEEECRARGAAQVLSHSFDVTDLLRLSTVLEATKMRFGRLDVSIANAGINRRRNVMESDGDKHRIVRETNQDAAVCQLRVSSQIMREQGFGHLMVVNSFAAIGHLNGQPGLLGYYESKCGLYGACKVIWNDVREFGIKVTSIYPGLIDNPLGRRPGPFQYNLQSLITDDACADALMYAYDGPKESCVTTIVLREQWPYSDATLRIKEFMQSQSKL
jgi:3-hydroxy acid dehydrogenase / malonic semialdehyde reductase